VKRQVVDLESGYITLLINRDFNCSIGSVHHEIPVFFPYDWQSFGQEVVLLMNEDFGPCEWRHKNYTAVFVS
jgi:hypothetical protein